MRNERASKERSAAVPGTFYASRVLGGRHSQIRHWRSTCHHSQASQDVNVSCFMTRDGRRGQEQSVHFLLRLLRPTNVCPVSQVPTYSVGCNSVGWLLPGKTNKPSSFQKKPLVFPHNLAFVLYIQIIIHAIGTYLVYKSKFFLTNLNFCQWIRYLGLLTNGHVGNILNDPLETRQSESTLMCFHIRIELWWRK